MYRRKWIIHQVCYILNIFFLKKYPILEKSPISLTAVSKTGIMPDDYTVMLDYLLLDQNVYEENNLKNI